MNKSRSTKFSITIHPLGGENIDWKVLSKKEITENLRELKFKTPIEIARILSNINIFAESKSKKGEVRKYYSRTDDFGGQLELGTEKGTPHYQLWVQLTFRNTKAKLLKYLSQVIYEQDRTEAISVGFLSEDIEAYKVYCSKETRAELLEEYEYYPINKGVSEFDKYVEENPESKKYWINRWNISDG